jgi:hypothetical protein
MPVEDKIDSIIGIISPTSNLDPVILTPCNEFGSLEDVFSARRRKDSPPFWDHPMKWNILLTVVHLIAGRHLIACTPPNLTQVKIWEYLKMETLIEHD